MSKMDFWTQTPERPMAAKAPMGAVPPAPQYSTWSIFDQPRYGEAFASLARASQSRVASKKKSLKK